MFFSALSHTNCRGWTWSRGLTGELFYRQPLFCIIGSMWSHEGQKLFCRLTGNLLNPKCSLISSSVYFTPVQLKKCVLAAAAAVYNHKVFFITSRCVRQSKNETRAPFIWFFFFWRISRNHTHMYTVAVWPSCCLHVSEDEVDKISGVQGSAGSHRDGVNSEPYWWVAPTKKTDPEPSASNRQSGESIRKIQWIQIILNFTVQQLIEASFFTGKQYNEKLTVDWAAVTVSLR